MGMRFVQYYSDVLDKDYLLARSSYREPLLVIIALENTVDDLLHAST